MRIRHASARGLQESFDVKAGLSIISWPAPDSAALLAAARHCSLQRGTGCQRAPRTAQQKQHTHHTHDNAQQTQQTHNRHHAQQTQHTHNRLHHAQQT
ncbi:hypothetical protein, partial [Herbaspirillum sp.]|uniref:hypothetical protein n=1 Tax=Herbaspirillum sp. TaxID=1890675 RepID=UPI00258487C0